MTEGTGSSDRVAAWLEGLGLGQYTESFLQNAITWELLEGLNEQDLRELGVVALGHRKQILKAIATLQLSVAPSFPSPDAAEWAHGERRQITVMTCDLVNSVALSARYDPEDLAEIISAYHTCCERIVRQFEGYVARFTGDGLKAYFGYPRASEHDPERAVRAALALISAVRSLTLRPGLVLSTRIGIATGDVVVGEVIGSGEAHERTVAGETPNLAARLQAMADPDSVIIADATKRMIGRLFEYMDLGRNVLKGFPEPVQAWRVLTEGPVVSHFEAIRSEADLTPLIDRLEELDFLRQSWVQARLGNGRTILLSGEAGVGKSRLSVALRHNLLGESFASLYHYCSPYHQNSAFYPIIKQLERDAQISSGDPPAARLDRLEKLASRYELDTAHAVPLFALLLSVPTNSRYPQLSYSPRQQKRLVLHELEARIIKLATKTPLLIVFEDMHWIDPSTREFIDRLIKQVLELPILLLMTCRPDFQQTLDNSLNVTTRVLNRLPRQESEQIVRALDTGLGLSSKSFNQILEYSNGLPLFLEELTRAALEAKPEPNQSDRSKIGPAIRVPATLRDSLLARLDRLGPHRVVAQTGAVIGRHFTFKLLAALFPQDLAKLKDALQSLVRAELIVEHGKHPEVTYTFTHALLQDAAVECLLHSDRRAIHLRIAQCLEKDFPEITKAEPELLALHYAGAGLADAAVTYWEIAAERALQRSANLEAAAHCEQALALLDTLPASMERDERELKLQTRLGATLTTIKGFAAPEVAVAYERARALSRESQDPVQRFSVLRGLWVYDLVRAEWQAASHLAEQMLVLAREQHDAGCELESHRALGMTLLWRGMFVRARDHLEAGSRLYDPEQHRAHAFRFGNDPKVACLVHEAFVLWVLGYPDQALVISHEAVTFARDLGHPFSLAQALTYSAFIHQCRGEPEAIKKPADEVTALALEHGFPFWRAEAGIMAGWATVTERSGENGIVQLRKGITDFLATGARMDRPRWLTLLAEAYGKNNQWRDGLEAIEEALRVIDETNECFFQARLYQLKGELLLKDRSSGAAVRAEECFLHGLEIARRQQARSWELCVATSLARLWRAQFRRREAFDLLSPVYHLFTEGFDTADVRNAKLLLDELS